MSGLGVILPVLCAAGGTAAGIYSRSKQLQRVKILSALADCIGEILFLLQSGFYSTAEILDICVKTTAGERLSCLGASKAAAENGEDLYEAWERESAAFCKKHGLDTAQAAIMEQMIRLLGSMDYAGQCAAYAALADKAGRLRDTAQEKYRKNGAAAVKIGLLGGIGLGLLLWKP